MQPLASWRTDARVLAVGDIREDDGRTKHHVRVAAIIGDIIYCDTPRGGTWLTWYGRVASMHLLQRRAHVLPPGPLAVNLAEQDDLHACLYLRGPGGFFCTVQVHAEHFGWSTTVTTYGPGSADEQHHYSTSADRDIAAHRATTLCGELLGHAFPGRRR